VSDEVQKFDVVAENGAAMRLEFEAESSRLHVSIGAPGEAVHKIDFSNIGEGDPLEFLSDRDWSYMKSKIFGAAGRTPSFLETVVSIRNIIESPEEHDLSLSEAATLLGDVEDAMVNHAGDDVVSCHGLIRALQRAGFHDDTHHMIVNGEPKDVRSFRANIWEPIQKRIEVIIDTSPYSPFDLTVDEDDETPEFC
jgi:hypothetical protein